MKELIRLMKKKLADSDEELTKLEIIMITYLLKVDKNIKKLIKETSQNTRFLKILEDLFKSLSITCKVSVLLNPEIESVCV